MVPQTYFAFFTASAGAGAALIGLLFVAISIAPERSVTGSAPQARRALSASTFIALSNAFFISLFALIPEADIGWAVVVMGSLSLVQTLRLGWTLLKGRHDWRSIVRRSFLILASLVVFALELTNGLALARNAHNLAAVFTIAVLLFTAYGLGLIHAWELLGAQRTSFFAWLSLLRDLDDEAPAATTAELTTTTTAAHARSKTVSQPRSSGR
jgi:hypothetical protein